jgi:taurine dioxygenase
MSITTASRTLTPVFTKLASHMAVAVHGVDLNQTPDPELFASLHKALLDHQVLCIRDQDIGPAAFLAAISLFGEAQVRPWIPSVPGFPAVTTLSSEDRDTKGDGKRLVAGATWHTDDDSFMAAPSALTALHGVIVPSTGGDTDFANLYAAYDALPEDMKHRLDGMQAVHMMAPDRDDIGRRRSIAPEVRASQVPSTHPVVRTHPETGRKALYISRNRIDHIVGMDRAEGHRLIDELTAHATQPRLVYRHKWRTGDVVIWDNRCLLHRANGDYAESERRFMRRIIVMGDVPA